MVGMGLFDKIKNFAGGHGVTAKITSVERQPTASVNFPLTDSVMKFQVEVGAEKEAVVLAHKFEVWAERMSQQNPRLIHVASDTHDVKTDIIGGSVKWPYTIQPGQTIQDGCCITDVDLSKALKEMGVSNPTSVLRDPSYRFFVKFVADVKGSPMDASAEVSFNVTA